MLSWIPSIDRYILRLVLLPMIGVFVLAASLLLLDKMLRLFDFVATEGGPVGIVFQMLGALMPEYASLAIPLGLLLGILLAFPQAGDLERTRRDARDRPLLWTTAARALHPRADPGGGERGAGVLHPAGQPLHLRAARISATLGRARRVDQGRRVHHARGPDGAQDRREPRRRAHADRHFRPRAR